MSELNEWLKERRAIHDAATEGPWEAEGHAPENSDYQSFGVAAGDVYVVFELPWDAAGAGKLDAEAIVDAHNTLPALLTAVEKVLELHVPETEYPDPITGECSCVECNRADREGICPTLYPCPTVLAVQSAIEGATNDH